MPSEPRVSVVTPVFNGERHLQECVESVLSQSYRNWDYTIVNNSSTDGTLAIARALAAEDPRIRVRDNERFLGVMASHNAALREISEESRYCKVVAADDRIEPHCLSEMVRVAESDPRVAIVGTRAFDGTVVRYEGLQEGVEVVPGRDVCRRNLLGGPYVFGVPTTVLYRSDIVRSRDAFYDPSNLHADTEVCFEFLADRYFGFVHDTLAFVRVREDSITSFAERIDTHRAGWLRILIEHGHRYLSDEERDALIRRGVREYRRFLGDELFKHRGDEFWSYHRARLEELGFPLTRRELARQAVRFAFDRFLRHPVRTLGNVRRRLRA